MSNSTAAAGSRCGISRTLMVARVPFVGCGPVGAHVVSLSVSGFVGAALGIQLVHPFLACVEFFAGSGGGLAMRARGVLQARGLGGIFASASACKALAFASVSWATASRLSQTPSPSLSRCAAVRLRRGGARCARRTRRGR